MGPDHEMELRSIAQYALESRLRAQQAQYRELEILLESTTRRWHEAGRDNSILRHENRRLRRHCTLGAAWKRAAKRWWGRARAHEAVRAAESREFRRTIEMMTRLAALTNGTPDEAAARSRWIPVAERLPDRQGTYLVFAESADPEKPLCITAHWLGREEGWVIVPVWAPAISHWMPLPVRPTSVKIDGRSQP